ncbi:MAG TPA: M20/M25/M40 family metallo-hydrolase [Longimicrobiaceae bacterium]
MTPPEAANASPRGRDALDEVDELLSVLTALPGPTGEEDAVIEWLAGEWEARGELSRTPVGNLMLRLRGDGPRVLLAAHADELSMIVRCITPEGFLRVVPGERDHFASPYFLGATVRILARNSEPIRGVFATTTGHALTLEQREQQKLGWDDVFVDTGMTAAELTARGVGVGTRMVWDAPLRRMGRLRVGKALDDRAGLAVLVALGRRLAGRKLSYDVTLAATVQEEIGLLGAASLARAGREYDLGFIIDNGLAGDIPTVSEEHMPVRLGSGPALVHRDSSAHYSPHLIRELHATARESGIPVQDAVLYHYASDGANLVRQGMQTVLIAPPIRYSHSPFEAVDPADIVATIDLLTAFLSRETRRGSSSRAGL